MKKFNYIIKDELGLHARPAGQVVKVAIGFQSKITIATPVKSADAKRIMGVMQLAAKYGDELTITCEGADETAAAKALEAFVKEKI